MYPSREFDDYVNMIIDELDDSLERRREILIDISNSQIYQTQQSLSREKMEMNVDKKKG